MQEGIPLIESLDGEVRNLEEDFKNLYPKTLSGRMIAQFIGKVVGPVGEIKSDEYAYVRLQHDLRLD